MFIFFHCSDCHSHAVYRWKPALVPWSIPVEPDFWTCSWFRAVKDSCSAGPRLGWHVHRGARWGEWVFMTALWFLLSVSSYTQHTVFDSWNLSLFSCFIIHAFSHSLFYSVKISTHGGCFVDFQRNTITSTRNSSWVGWIKKCSAKHSCFKLFNNCGLRFCK